MRLPTIKVVKEMPGSVWALYNLPKLQGYNGLYCWKTNTIYVLETRRWIILHELIHWAAQCIGGYHYWLHDYIDDHSKRRAWRWLLRKIR